MFKALIAWFNGGDTVAEYLAAVAEFKAATDASEALLNSAEPIPGGK